MRSRLAILLALTALVVGVPVALGGSSHAAANSQTFNDSIGEDASAPDITSIVVSNDDAGLITFQINVSNRPAFTPDMYFLVFIDADKNPSTGDTNSVGAEYAIDLEPGAVGLFQWNGTTYAPASSQTSLTYAYASTGPTIHVSAAELGRRRRCASEYSLPPARRSTRTATRTRRTSTPTWRRTRTTASTRTRC